MYPMKQSIIFFVILCSAQTIGAVDSINFAQNTQTKSTVNAGKKKRKKKVEKVEKEPLSKKLFKACVCIGTALAIGYIGKQGWNYYAGDNTQPPVNNQNQGTGRVVPPIDPLLGAPGPRRRPSSPPPRPISPPLSPLEPAPIIPAPGSVHPLDFRPKELSALSLREQEQKNIQAARAILQQRYQQKQQAREQKDNKGVEQPAIPQVPPLAEEQRIKLSEELHVAVGKNDQKEVKRLLEAKADTTYLNAAGCNPLDIAVLENHYTCIPPLIKAKATMSDKSHPISWWISNDLMKDEKNTDAFLREFTAGQINTRIQPEEGSYEYFLHSAVRHNLPNLVRSLIARQADPTVVDVES